MTASEPELGWLATPLPTLEIAANEIDLFRFSATTWNAHRIHYDAARAGEEGLPGTVVQAHLHGAWMARLAISIAGSGARLRALQWTNRRPVVANEPVTISAEAIDVAASSDGAIVRLALVEHGVDGSVRVTGEATVQTGRGVA
ncbi:MAG: acyl dehydratase [Acidimicrobiia bacterium]